MVDLRFVYIVSDNWKEHLRYEWLYVYRMARFYQWWIKKNFRLYYNVKSDVMLVIANKLTRWRFGMRDIVEDHREKGEHNYDIYLSYFKPLISDCAIGYYMDNLGLVKWKYYNGHGDLIKFLALENCTKVSHIILHQIAKDMRKEVKKKYHDAIHDQWAKHVYGEEDYDYYNEKYEKVSNKSRYMFATMKIPKP
jgi:hypothetical protein